MNYKYHIKLHTQKTEAEEAAYQQHLRDRDTALRVACEEASSIIRKVILPEMETMATAIREAGRKCELTISSCKITGIIPGSSHQAEFEIEIALKSSVFHTLTFRAEPDDKLFRIILRTPDSTPDDMENSHPYSKITGELVAAQCAQFVRTLFPL